MEVGGVGGEGWSWRWWRLMVEEVGDGEGGPVLGKYIFNFEFTKGLTMEKPQNRSSFREVYSHF